MLCWIDHAWSSKECVCCAYDPNERLSAPSICFVCVFVLSEIISSFRSLRAGSQVFALLMLFLCVILHTAIAMHLALWYVVLVCHQYDVCDNSVGIVYVGGYGGLSESGLCVFCKLCPACFLVVGKGLSVLL